MKKPSSPTKDLTRKEAGIYLDKLVDYYTEELSEDIQSYNRRQEKYESTIFA